MKINKEIQRYQESILFGLSLRQMVFALLAIGVAVGAYFGLKPLIGAAEVGWVCMLAAFPFAMCGFFTYNGMPAERFLLAVIRSEILCPRTLAYIKKPVLIYGFSRSLSTAFRGKHQT